MRVCIDPGHGMGNRAAGRYDPGACAGGVEEAAIALEWANELRAILKALNVSVTRTRIDDKDPAPVGQRAGIAKDFGCDVMLSIHCNAADGSASGTETFYRGETNKALAARVNAAAHLALGTKDRGIKTEQASQHSRLAVLAFPRCCLLEIGFIDHPGDRAKMLDPDLRHEACMSLAKALTV